MKIPFSNTTLKNGLIQICERNCGFADGGISGDTTLLPQFTADINLAVDEVFGFMFPLGGTWQLDDNNHGDYPFIYTSIVSGRRDYTFDTDEQGNVILDIYRVMAADSTGVFRELQAVDQQSLNSNQEDTNSLIDGQNLTGTPTRYDKTGNSIFLDLIPNYNYSNGLKVFINREAYHFLSTDTTTSVGFAHLFQEYFALAASYRYAYRKLLGNKADLEKEMLKMRQAIMDYYGSREKDAPGRLIANVENTE